MHAAKLRATLRWFHIVLSLCIGGYLYSPLHGQSWAADVLRWAIVPLLALTGVFMWKQGPITRLLGLRS